jgi:hypothetical protein
MLFSITAIETETRRLLAFKITHSYTSKIFLLFLS